MECGIINNVPKNVSSTGKLYLYAKLKGKRVKLTQDVWERVGVQLLTLQHKDKDTKKVTYRFKAEKITFEKEGEEPKDVSGDVTLQSIYQLISQKVVAAPRVMHDDDDFDEDDDIDDKLEANPNALSDLVIEMREPNIFERALDSLKNFPGKVVEFVQRHWRPEKDIAIHRIDGDEVPAPDERASFAGGVLADSDDEVSEDLY